MLADSATQANANVTNQLHIGLQVRLSHRQNLSPTASSLLKNIEWSASCIFQP